MINDGKLNHVDVDAAGHNSIKLPASDCVENIESYLCFKVKAIDSRMFLTFYT